MSEQILTAATEALGPAGGFFMLLVIGALVWLARQWQAERKRNECLHLELVQAVKERAEIGEKNAIAIHESALIMRDAINRLQNENR